MANQQQFLLGSYAMAAPPSPTELKPILAAAMLSLNAVNGW
jgi:hypothetical protein